MNTKPIVLALLLIGPPAHAKGVTSSFGAWVDRVGD
jgi:hypothetical protein